MIVNEGHCQSYDLANAWYLAYYLPVSMVDASRYSDSLRRFKSNVREDVEFWGYWAINEIVGLGTRFDLIIRALGSSETSISGNPPYTPLDLIGRALQSKGCGAYRPSTLCKSRSTRPLHLLPQLRQRQEELRGVYNVCDSTVSYNRCRILLIDDIATSGTTLVEILRALRNVWPDADYYYFTLGRTSHEANANNSIVHNSKRDLP